jgi:hypothetical protein
MSTLYQFKAAVYLNNTGVSLLQRRCYRQAVETFRDAIIVIKAPSPSSSPIEDHATSRGLEAPVLERRGCFLAMQEKLRVAAQRLSNPMPSTGDIANQISVQVLSDDEGPNSLLCGAYLQATGSLCSDASKTVYLVRMEPADFEDPSEKDAAVEASVILYNYSMGFRCLYSASTSPLFATRFHSASFDIGRNAYSTLTTRGNGDIARTIFVALIVIRHLVDLSHQLGRERDYNEFLSHHCILQASVRKLGAMQSKLGERAASAA